MDTNDVKLAAVILTAVLLSIGLPAACTVKQSTIIAEMVKDGADPIQAACAIRGNDRNAACVLATVKR